MGVIGIGNPAFEDVDDDSFPLISQDIAMKEEESGGSGKLSVVKWVEESECGMKFFGRPMQTNQEAEEDTFRLAKDSSLFSQVSNNSLTSANIRDLCYHEPREQKVQMVEVKALEIVKSVVTSVEPMEVYPSSSCHLAPQTVEMVQIGEDTEESAPDTDSESPAIARRISPLPVHVKSFSEILLKGKGTKPTPLPRSSESVKPIQVVEVKPEETPPLCLEMTDRVKRMEETTVTAWRRKDSNDGIVHVPDDIDKENGPKVTLRKEVEVSKTYQLIGNFSSNSQTDQNTNESLNLETIDIERNEDIASTSVCKEMVRRGKRTVGQNPEGRRLEDENWEHRKRVKTEWSKDVEEWDRDSFYASDKETDDVVEFSDNESIAAAVSSHAIIDTSDDDTSSSDDEDPALYIRGDAAGKVGRSWTEMHSNPQLCPMWSCYKHIHLLASISCEMVLV